MTNAVKQAAKFGFSKLRLKRIYAYVFAPNKASRRVLRKAGFRSEGQLKKNVIKKGKYYDDILYAKINSRE